MPPQVKCGQLIECPRSQKHGTTSKPLKPTRLDQEEQEKIAKTGMEMKMGANEMDAETDKWNNADENNDIVKRAKNMSAMAMAMYQFTKGEGTLKTTQDLFTQAEYFAEEANRLYKVVRQFSYQVRRGEGGIDLKWKANCDPFTHRFRWDSRRKSCPSTSTKFLRWCRRCSSR